ncbi:MAG: aspartate kinase [Anaerolineae bacterium]|nr:aspartate kinase [Anaerolineae bacterium]
MQQLRKILVMKFGGTSVGSPAAMKQVLEIIRSTHRDWPQLVVVTSALSGVTDLLLKSAMQAAEGEIHPAEAAAAKIIQRHEALIDNFITDANLRQSVKREIHQLTNEFLNLCQSVRLQSDANRRSLDAIAGFGERFAIRILAGALNAMGMNATGVEATQLIVTDDNFSNAEPDMRATSLKTRQALDPLLRQEVIPVVTGFIAATPDQIPTTLGRGGSDYSAAILAAALKARETWIWTDVDGVMTADPRLVPEARSILQLSYDEVAEMASLGAKVLHPKTIQPIIQAGGTLRVRNTFNPTYPGTLLVQNNSSARGEQAGVKAVTVIRGMKWVKLGGGKERDPDLYYRLLNAAAAEKRIPLIVESPHDAALCFAVPKESFSPTIGTSARRCERNRTSWKKQVTSEDADMVTVICPGLRSSPGVAGRVFSALEQARIRVLASSYGASDISMNLFISSTDTQNAMRILHGLIQ